MRLRTWLLSLSMVFLAHGAMLATPTADPAPAGETRLLRFPAVHGDTVVFTYAGDLYAVPATGGTARKLTTDPGYEMFARFSPDGRHIAFTAQYDGSTEVYVIPAEGGVPKRLTYSPVLGRDDVSDRLGPNNIVIGWKDNDTIVFRARAEEWNDMVGRLCLVGAGGGPVTRVPLPRGGFCSFSPDGGKLAYNRVFREFRTWKRYRGGQADDVWIHDFATRRTINLTSNAAQDIIPMWSGNKVYFLSDRDELKRMNLYVCDLETRATRKLTDFRDYDVKFPSLGDKAIAFENGGELYLLDLTTEKARKVLVRVLDDFDTGRGGLVSVADRITGFGLAPDANRAVFSARGDVFTVPAKYGPTRNLTRTPGVHDRDAEWSPDGRRIAFLSDRSGEDEIYVCAQNGGEEPVAVTSGGDVYKYGPRWSPDGKKLLWADRKQRLQFVDVDTRQVTLVDQATAFEITDFTWSPDGKWVSWTRPEEKSQSVIYLYSLETGRKFPVTDGWFSSRGPAFSRCGKYLFFVSDRSFQPTYGRTEFNHVYLDMSGLFFVTLDAAAPSFLAPRSDEVKFREPGAEPAAEGKTAKAEDTAEKEASPEKDKGDPEPAGLPTVRVDEAGLADRIASLPLPASTYFNLQAAKDRLYYQRVGRGDNKPRLFVYDLEKLKETEVAECGAYEISADGRKMMLFVDNAYAIVDLPSGRADVKERLDLSGLQVTLDRRAEWNQIYRECWRQMRDFFYAPNMHGVDWAALRDRYARLLPWVNHRSDLTYLIGELIGELNAGHAYVGGGDQPAVKRVPVGRLGAVLDRDPSGSWKVTRVLRGQNWERSLRSPLTEIGVDVKAGDFILAVDGVPTRDVANVYELLVGKAGRQVTLRVNGKPSDDGARDVRVVPVEDEKELYYYNWVRENVEKVDKATNGRVGYLHVPDMGPEGLNQFAKMFYPQLRKEALVVDVRGNGGGNVSFQIVERLRRDPIMFDVARNAAVNLNPGGMVMGPKVLLVNELSMSDGDIVGYRFRKYGLGKIVGTRTWGGVVGIRGTLPLLDGGFLNRPEFSRYDLDGKEWIMEGVGVQPDIVVDNDPAKEYDGVDEQLDKAIAVVLEDLKSYPVRPVPPPPYPDKSR